MTGFELKIHHQVHKVNKITTEYKKIKEGIQREKLVVLHN
jgi:hypothetical protein